MIYGCYHFKNIWRVLLLFTHIMYLEYAWYDTTNCDRIRKCNYLLTCMYDSFNAAIGYSTSTYVCTAWILWHVRFNAQLSAVWDRFHYRLPDDDIVHTNTYRYIQVHTGWNRMTRQRNALPRGIIKFIFYEENNKWERMILVQMYE